MLGPLKFGLQQPVSAVKAAAAPARFELVLSLEGGTINYLSLDGPKGATAYVDWGDGTISPITLSGTQASVIGSHSCGTVASISGSNLITLLRFIVWGSNKLTAIQGTYPTALKEISLGFNSENPNFTLPNVSNLEFSGLTGPSSLTTGSNLIKLDNIPPNLSSLNLNSSTKLNSLLFADNKDLTTISLPPSCTILAALRCTGLTRLNIPSNSKCSILNVTGCTGLTTVSFPPALTTLRMEGSGLTTLDLSKTNVTTLNIPPSMDAQLKTVAFGSKLKPSGLFRFEIPEDGNWNLY